MNRFLFVYGKLRKEGSSALVEKYAEVRFVGSATVDGSLFDLGEYPGLSVDGSGNRVIGDIYEVDANILTELDAFEASAGYHRRELAASTTGSSIDCWVYLPDPDRCLDAPRISSGDWIEYLLRR